MKGFVDGKSPTGRIRLAYKLGTVQPVRVCRRAFEAVYLVCHDTLNSICYEIKRGIEDNGQFHDKSNGHGSTKKKRERFLTDMENRHGIVLLPNQEASLFITNTPETLRAWAWLDYYFKLVGDCAPNSTEIHLDPCQFQDVYKLYKREVKENPLSYERILQLWHECFP